MTYKRIKISMIILSVTLILLLSACGGNNNTQQDDPNLAITQVFETAMAALTETAAVQSPTPTYTSTVLPTFTAAPTLEATATISTLPTATTSSPSFVQPTSQTSSCDIGGFVQDVTIPDGTTIAAGQDFTKTWRIKNNGTCTWDENYTVVYYSGEQMAEDTIYSFTTDNIEPGESVDVSVPMTAPTSNGEYYSYWVMRNDLGQTFYIDGGAIYVQITVGTVTSSTATPTTTGATTTPTATPGGGSSPDVTLVSPLNGDSYLTTDTVSFSATATDPEDGTITTSSSFQWFDNETLIHTGISFTSFLSEGTHNIKVRVTDSDNNTNAESITITVTAP